MRVRVNPPAAATGLRDLLRLGGLIAYEAEATGVVVVHDLNAPTNRDARLAITAAVSFWTHENRGATVELLDYRD